MYTQHTCIQIWNNLHKTLNNDDCWILKSQKTFLGKLRMKKEKVWAWRPCERLKAAGLGQRQRPARGVTNRDPSQLWDHPCSATPVLTFQKGRASGRRHWEALVGNPGAGRERSGRLFPISFLFWCCFLPNLKKKKNLYLVSRDFIQNHHCKGSRNCLTEYALARPAGISRVKANGLPFFPRSAAKSCPTLCDPTNCSTPGLPLLHHLPELARTHVHQVRDVVQPSHPLSPPSPPAPNLAQHQGLF